LALWQAQGGETFTQGGTDVSCPSQSPSRSLETARPGDAPPPSGRRFRETIEWHSRLDINHQALGSENRGGVILDRFFSRLDIARFRVCCGSCGEKESSLCESAHEMRAYSLARSLSLSLSLSLVILADLGCCDTSIHINTFTWL
jgi:hypothetical protein